MTLTRYWHIHGSKDDLVYFIILGWTFDWCWW